MTKFTTKGEPMPWDHRIIGLQNFEILSVKGTNFLNIKARYTGKVACCKCSSEDLRKKDRFERRVRHVCFGDRLSELLIEGFKFYCKHCKTYCRQRFPGILPRRRASESFRKQVSRQHHEGI